MGRKKSGAESHAEAASDGAQSDLGSMSGLAMLRQMPGIAWRGLHLVWVAGRRELLFAIGLQVTSGVSIAAGLLLLHEILSVFSKSAGSTNLSSLVPALVAFAVVTAAAGFASAVAPEQRLMLTELVSKTAMDGVLDITCAVDLETYESHTFHDHLERVQKNALSTPHQLVYGLLTLLQSLITAVSISFALLLIQPVLVVFIVGGLIPLWLTTRLNSRDMFRFIHDITPRDRERGYLTRILTGKDAASEVRSFNLPNFLRNRYDQLYGERIDLLQRVVRGRMRRSLIGSAAVSLAIVGVLSVLILLVLSGRMSLADAAVSALAARQLSSMMQSLNTGMASLLDSVIFLRDYESFLQVGKTLEKTRPSAPAPAGFGRLKVNDLSFTYPGASKPVLHNIDLEIRAGQSIAIVGRNGSGKTTLAKLLCGLYMPTSGQINWDSTDISKCDPAQLREAISVIFQDFMRYELSAHANIALGRHSHYQDDSAVKYAAVQAGIHNKLESLDHGYETVLSKAFDDSTELSLGQWQAISLARAFFRDARFLILDEPTAALDAQAEYELFETIRTLTKGRSLLLISHRLASVRAVDRIYVLEHGRIIESGNHDDLISADGHYAQLFRLQASGYSSQAEPLSR